MRFLAEDGPFVIKYMFGIVTPFGLRMKKR